MATSAAPMPSVSPAWVSRTGSSGGRMYAYESLTACASANDPAPSTDARDGPADGDGAATPAVADLSRMRATRYQATGPPRHNDTQVALTRDRQRRAEAQPAPAFSGAQRAPLWAVFGPQYIWTTVTILAG